MIVTIVGAGNMGRGIGTRALIGGHSVRLYGHKRATADELATALSKALPGADVAAIDAESVADSDIVVLALPYPAGRDVAAAWSGTLAGKVVVDISNPVDFSTFDSLAVPAGTSAAEEIAAAAPQARVVKAFNTTFAGPLAIGVVAGRPLDVFIAGDEETAKESVRDSRLTSSTGLLACMRVCVYACASFVMPATVRPRVRAALFPPAGTKTCRPEKPHARV